MGKRSSSVNVGQESQSSCLSNHPVHPKPRATPKPTPRATPKPKPRATPRQSPRQRASQPPPRGELSARQGPPKQQQLILPTLPMVLLLEASAHPPPPPPRLETTVETMPLMESRCLAIRAHRTPPLLPPPHPWHWRSSPP